MSARREVVLIAARALAILLLVWALLDLVYLPEYLVSLSHYTARPTVLSTDNYWSNHYRLVTAACLFRVLFLTCFSRVLWKCGPRIENLFSETASS
jgi:hypothetical protein